MAAKILTFILIFGINLIAFSDPEEFRIIYIIHGDANYLFHDDKGNSLNAAERILDQAQYVAENIKRGEVYIFYHKPSEKFLFFASDDGEFYYYKNGIKISAETYSREGEKYFEAESGLIKEFSGELYPDRKNIILYYGHHIPEEDSSGYHSSYPDRKFGINIFTDGLRRITNSLQSPDEKIDLLILSTCRNGDENTLTKLSPITNYLIASTEDIHLSHLNSESLIEICNRNFVNIKETAMEFASYAFDELSFLTSTEISVNVYNLNEYPGKKPEYISRLYRSPEFGLRKNQTIKKEFP